MAVTQGLEQAMTLLTTQGEQLGCMEAESEALRTAAGSSTQVWPLVVQYLTCA